MGRFTSRGPTLAAALAGLALAAHAQTPTAPSMPPIVEPNLRQVQLPGTEQPLPVAPSNLSAQAAPGSDIQAPSGLAGAFVNQADKAGGTPPVTNTTQGASTQSRTADAAPAGSTTNSITGAGGAAGAAINAPDVGDLLSKSIASTGVEIQRRNGIVADARLRGLRSTQYMAVADYANYMPSRLDLDSLLSRFDSGSVRDVIVIKGPYSALYGPGFGFLDIATFDSPRYDCLQVHGRSAVTYQTNGARWDAVQAIQIGDQDWGFRATYNFLQGNDYKAGDGTRVPASYLSNNVNFALGWNLTEKSSIEIKGLSVTQNDVQFPGLYFDIRNLSTQAYSARYKVVDQEHFDLLTLDVWYNSTAATGDTQLRPKQDFVQTLLSTSFQGRTQGVANGPNQFTNTFTDQSSTNFAGRSIGYRLATSWGPKDAPLLTIGTDLNVYGTGLDEYIRFTQTGGFNINTGQLIPSGGPFPTFNQNQSIPKSQSADPGLFVQSQFKVTDALKFTAGGRYDYVFTGSYPRQITGNVNLFGPPANLGGGDNFSFDPIIYSSNPQNQALQRQFNLGSGFLTSEYAVTNKVTALAAIGYSMRAPSLTELYASGPFIGVLQQGTSRLIGDPNLSPEKLYQVDIGLRADYETWQAGINGWFSYINDYITYDANRLGQGLTQVVYTNTDRATLAGGELFGQFNMTSWLTPFGTLSYVQGIDQTAIDNRRASNLFSSRRDAPQNGYRKSQTEPLPQIPPLEVRAGLRVHDPRDNPRWQVEFTARLVSEQNNVATSLGELPTKGFGTYDIRAFYRVTDNWLITGGVENIGDFLYREHLDFISGNLLNSGPLYRPGLNFFFGSQLTY